MQFGSFHSGRITCAFGLSIFYSLEDMIKIVQSEKLCLWIICFRICVHTQLLQEQIPHAKLFLLSVSKLLKFYLSIDI